MSESGPDNEVKKEPAVEARERSVEDAYAVKLLRPSDDKRIMQREFDRIAQDPYFNESGTYLLLAVQDLDNGSKEAIIGPADMKESEIKRFNDDSEEFFFGDSFDYLRKIPLEFLQEAKLN